MAAALQVLESRTVDTSKFPGDRDYTDRAESRMACVAYPYVQANAGGLKAFHVTDDPSLVLGILERGGDLQETRPYGNLCGGLYLSGCPDFWAGRSRKQWDFIETLDPEKQERLRILILAKLAEEIDSGYITSPEYENAINIVQEWRRTGYWHPIVIVAGQPFNVNIQRLAIENGIAQPFSPIYVEVDFRGRYLELMDRGIWTAAEDLASETLGISDAMMQREDVCRGLREHGWDGAFTRASMGTDPELVLWNGEAINTFGPEAAAGGGAAQMSGPGGNVIKKKTKRFDASIYMDHRQANIIDRGAKVKKGSKFVNGSLMLLEPAQVEEVRRIADAALHQIPWDFVALRRLEGRGRPEHGGVQIIDREQGTMMVELDQDALRELEGLAYVILSSMAGA